MGDFPRDRYELAADGRAAAIPRSIPLFLENRIALNPIYPGLYELTSTYLTDSKADKGAEAAFQSLFFVKDRGSAPEVPESPLEFIQTYVVNELIALRLALGGFADFGAINYCGFFGGANMPDRSAPYRTF